MPRIVIIIIILNLPPSDAIGFSGTQSDSEKAEKKRMASRPRSSLFVDVGSEQYWWWVCEGCPTAKGVLGEKFVHLWVGKKR